METDKKTDKKKLLKILFTVVTSAMILSVTVYLIRIMVRFIKDPDAFKDYVADRGVWGVLIFIFFVAIQVMVAVIPGGPFQVAAGYAYGNFWGTVFCMIGCTIGSMVVFFLVRKYGEKVILLFFKKEQLDKIKIVIDAKKAKILLAVIFIIPGTPKDFLTYYAGITNIKPLTWALICSFGRLPAILLSAYAGDYIQNEKYKMAIIAFAIILVGTACGALCYKLYEKRKLKKHNEALEKAEKEKEESEGIG